MMQFQLFSLLATAILKDENATKGYCRMDSCYAGNYSVTTSIFSNQLDSYPMCEPASNDDCANYRLSDGSVTSTNVSVSPNCLWTGIAYGKKCITDTSVMKGDRIIYRQAKSEPILKYSHPDCTLHGNFGTRKCTEGGDKIVREVQVVLAEWRWYAVTRSSIITVPHGDKTCFSNKGYVQTCTELELAEKTCICIENTVHNLYLRASGGKNVLIDGVGTRLLDFVQPYKVVKRIDCSIIEIDDQLKMQASINLSGRKILMRRGQNSQVCYLDDSYTLCNMARLSPALIVVKVYEESDEICSASYFDKRHSKCDDYWYGERIKHMVCWSAIEWSVFTFCILLLLAVILLVIVLTVYLIGYGCVCGKKCCSCLRTLCRCGRNAARGMYRQVRRRAVNGIDHLTHMAILMLMFPMVMAAPSCDTMDLAAFSYKCGTDSCLVEGTTEFNVPATSSTVCLKGKGQDIDALEIVFDIIGQEYKCVPSDEYYTAYFQAKFCGDNFCPENCYGGQDDISQRVSRMGCKVDGTDFRIARAGCAGNGCTRCDEACWIGRKYWDVKTPAIRVFMCSHWIPVVKMKVSLTTGFLTKTKTVELTKLSPIEEMGMRINWISSDFNPSNVYGKSFVETPHGTCKIDAAPKGSPDPSRIGYVQCPTPDSVTTQIGCLKNTAEITCTGSNKDSVTCLSQRPDWRVMCKDSYLPMTELGQTVIAEGGVPIVSNMKFGSLRFVVQLTTPHKVSIVSPKATCLIADATISGCFNCEAGASLDLVSTPTGGKPRVSVTCESGIHPFVFTCGDSSIKIVGINSNIDTKCEARFGLQKTSFRVTGKLERDVKLPTMEDSSNTNTVNSGWGFWNPFSGFNKFKNILFSIFVIGCVGTVIYFLTTYIIYRRQRKNLDEGLTYREFIKDKSAMKVAFKNNVRDDSDRLRRLRNAYHAGKKVYREKDEML